MAKIEASLTKRCPVCCGNFKVPLRQAGRPREYCKKPGCQAPMARAVAALRDKAFARGKDENLNFLIQAVTREVAREFYGSALMFEGALPMPIDPELGALLVRLLKAVNKMIQPLELARHEGRSITGDEACSALQDNYDAVFDNRAALQALVMTRANEQRLAGQPAS